MRRTRLPEWVEALALVSEKERDRLSELICDARKQAQEAREAGDEEKAERLEEEVGDAVKKVEEYDEVERIMELEAEQRNREEHAPWKY